MNIDNYYFCKVHNGKIYFRGIDNQGNFVQDKFPFQPTYYIKTTNSKPDAFSVYGDPLKRKTFGSISLARKWKREMKEMGIDVYGDISEEIQFISELPKKKHITKEDLKILYYDIETTVDTGFPDANEAVETITAISTFDTVTNSVHIFTYSEFSMEKAFQEVDTDIQEHIKSYKIVEHQHTNEKDMLVDFIKYWKTIDPEVISGWNIDSFDNTYLYNRYKRLFGEKLANQLSPFGIVNKREYTNSFGKKSIETNFFGISSLDYLEVYKENTFHSMPNYKLDTVAEHELGIRKLDYDCTFKEFYENQWDRFILYNIRDTILVHEIDKASDLMSISVGVAYTCGVNYNDAFGTIKKIDALIYNSAKKENKIIPPQKEHKSGHFVGAYVHEPKPGRLKGVVSFDLTSLYPSIIRELNISPETLVTNPPKDIKQICDNISIDKLAFNEINLSPLQYTDYTVAPNGACFDVSKQGIIPKIVTDIFEGRKKNKKESFEHWHKADLIKKELQRRNIVV